MNAETVDEHVLLEKAKWNGRSTSDTILSAGEREESAKVRTRIIIGSQPTRIRGRNTKEREEVDFIRIANEEGAGKKLEALRPQHCQQSASAQWPCKHTRTSCSPPPPPNRRRRRRRQRPYAFLTHEKRRRASAAARNPKPNSQEQEGEKEKRKRGIARPTDRSTCAPKIHNRFDPAAVAAVDAAAAAAGRLFSLQSTQSFASFPFATGVILGRPRRV